MLSLRGGSLKIIKHVMRGEYVILFINYTLRIELHIIYMVFLSTNIMPVEVWPHLHLLTYARFSVEIDLNDTSSFTKLLDGITVIEMT